MSKIHMTFQQDFSAMRKQLGTMLSPMRLSDAKALLYSAKCFAAAMLAYFIALFIGLERPSWAIITVYIVSQTSVGASLSRCLYRLAGTVVGAAATVFIIPPLVTMPIVCSVALSGWIAFCLYLSLLERTPRAYAYVLAGYTASLIGFPGVSSPDALFSIAIIRVQEIMIGLLCAALVHRYILPAPIAGQFNAKLSQTISSARRQLAVSLSEERGTVSAPWYLAPSLQLLQGMSHHIPYDFSFSVAIRHARKALHDRLARLVIINVEIAERLQMMTRIPNDIQSLLDEVRQWLDQQELAKRNTLAQKLHWRIAQLAQGYGGLFPGVETRLQASVLRYLTEAITLLEQCDRLAETFYHTDATPLPSQTEAVQGYVFHQDRLRAIRSAFGAFTLILSGCLIWITSAWPEGATAVSILGVCCTLFAGFDAPAPHIMNYIIGCLWGVVLSLLYSFVILPDISDFLVLVAVFAPVYLLAGSLQARPPTAFMAMGITLTLPVLCDLGAGYSANIAEMLNTAVALFAATGFAIIGMRLLQTVSTPSGIHRIVQLSQHDLALCIKGSLRHNEIQWTNLMVDRAALLLALLPPQRPSSAQTLNHLLQLLRLGLCAIRLHRGNTPFNAEIARLLHRLDLSANTLRSPEPIFSLIDRALFAVSNSPSGLLLVDGLIDVHCILQEPNKDEIYDK